MRTFPMEHPLLELPGITGTVYKVRGHSRHLTETQRAPCLLPIWHALCIATASDLAD
jgi:hypothetical protein